MRPGALARWLAVLAGIVVTIAAAGAILQANAGGQPWDTELSDNFLFARSLPFTIGIGALSALLRRPWRGTARRASDGALRRFSPGTVVGHWLFALGLLLALPTGVWQYLGGVLDVRAPIPLYLFYRVHYLGATVLLFTTAHFLTYWWLASDRSLLVPRGSWPAHLRGLAEELPRPFRGWVARLLRIDLGARPPLTGQFTFYEKVFSFPSWAVVIGLITLTGIVKAMRYVVPIPGPVLYGASTLHVAAMAMIVIKLLDHLRYTAVRWPLMSAMVTTWMSERYARLRHPAWYTEARATAAAEPGPAAVAADAPGGAE